MAYAKQMKLVQKLADLTRVGSLEWKPSVKNDVFQLSFRDNTIRIGQNVLPGFEGARDIQIQLINGEGELVESFTDVDLENDIENPRPPGNWYPLMSDLYESARRIALGAEKVLDELLSDLDDIIPF